MPATGHHPAAVTRRSPVTTRSAPHAPIAHTPSTGPLTTGDADRLAELLLSHLRTGIHPFTALPRPLLDGDVKAMIRVCMRWASERGSAAATADPAAFLQVAAARWARADLPIEKVLHAMHVGFGEALEVVVARSGEPSCDRLIAWTSAAVELSDLCTGAISRAYVRELKATSGDHHTAVHTLTSALLAGQASSKVARECGIPIAEEYYVLAVHVAAHPDENRPGLDRHVVAGRKLRRIQSALTRQFQDRALAMLSVDGGTILLPADLCGEPELDRAVEVVADYAAAPVTAVMTRCATDAVPAAARRTHELLDTAESIGIGPGLHKFDDLALQYQLTRPGIGRRILETRIAPLDDHPELLRTLHIFFHTDMNRRRTARQLNIHPNTIDYRLRRIGQLTGFDPSRSQGLWYLRSALIARGGTSLMTPSPFPDRAGQSRRSA
ncbi:PucR family transcriptional regulator [Nocardia cerradoensis]|nr:helix-turn-helix domain-containing protein [Nocardia cerradoensis]NKY48468.1 PucR family transcriptional regulator [Nocardia cerradoensis]